VAVVDTAMMEDSKAAEAWAVEVDMATPTLVDSPAVWVEEANKEAWVAEVDMITQTLAVVWVEEANKEAWVAEVDMVTQTRAVVWVEETSLEVWAAAVVDMITQTLAVVWVEEGANLEAWSASQEVDTAATTSKVVVTNPAAVAAAGAFLIRVSTWLRTNWGVTTTTSLGLAYSSFVPVLYRCCKFKGCGSDV